MPVPTVYTENAFALYLADMLDSLADVLGWDGQDPHVREAVTDAVLEYGASDIATITTGPNLLKLRALGRRAIWRVVAQATAGDYKVVDNGQTLERQMVNDQAHKMLSVADADCRALGVAPGYSVSILHMKHPDDPYQIIPDEERLP